MYIWWSYTWINVRNHRQCRTVALRLKWSHNVVRLCDWNVRTYCRAGCDPSRLLKSQKSQTAQETIEHVPPNAQESSNRARWFIFEDNWAVIKKVIEGRSPHMRPDLRWHRVNLDGLFGRVNLNSNSSATYVDTHQQITNILTKILTHLTRVMSWWLCLALKLNLAIAAAKSNRSYQSKDYVQMFIGASSKSKPKNKRVHVLAAVPHDKSSPLSTAQEETHCDVKSL